MPSQLAMPMACSTTCRPIPPVAAKTVSFICSSGTLALTFRIYKKHNI